MVSLLVGMNVDYNQVQALGYSQDIENLAPLDKKLQEFGWAAKFVDGHNISELRQAFKEIPIEKDKPTAIICNTIKCKGIDYLENTVESHYRFIPDDKLEKVLNDLKEKQYR